MKSVYMTKVILLIILLNSIKLSAVDDETINALIAGDGENIAAESDSLLKINEYIYQEFDTDPDHYLKAARILLYHGEKNNDDLLVFKVLLTINDIFMMTSKPDSVYKCIQKAEMYITPGDNYKKSEILMRKGRYYEYLADYPSAIENFHQAINLLGSDSLKIARVYNNIGSIYLNWNDYSKALEYFERILKISKEDEPLHARALLNIGNVFSKLLEYDKAETYYKKSLDIFLKEDIKEQTVIAYNNLSAIYYYRKEYGKAIEFLEKAAEVNKQAGKISSLIKNYANISLIYGSSEQPEKQTFYIEKTKTLLKDISDPALIISIKEVIKSYLVMKGDYKAAYEALTEIEAIKDSSFTKESRKQIAELETKFNHEKQKREIQLLKNENLIKEMEIKRERMIKIGLIFGIVILLSLLYLIVFLYRQREKVNNELKLNLARLEEKDYKLKQVNDAKDRMFSIISHDLRNPLSAITALTQLLKMDYLKKDKDELLEDIDLISTASDQLYKLLENLLTWARTQIGHFHPVNEEMNLHNVIHESIAAMIPQATQKKVTIVNHIPVDLIITSDEDSIKTIVRNLINNGVKYSDAGSKIEISAEMKLTELQIIVKDYGMGMDEITKSKLFKLEETTSRKGTLKESGTGLGLILCKEIAELLGGKIWVESEPGYGSSFIFTIPQKSNLQEYKE